MTSANRPHHHGNLRAALIEAGVDLVREGGPDALSIRKVAARVGVSHAAPAHHFPSLVALRSAVATHAYGVFTASMEAAIAEAPDTPRDAITAAGIGYLRFARANPGLFHLVFGGSEMDEDDPEFCAAGADAYGVLARVCAPVAHGPAGAQGTETLVWSIAHGFASLILRGKDGPDAPADPEELYRAIAPHFAIAGTPDEND